MNSNEKNLSGDVIGFAYYSGDLVQEVIHDKNLPGYNDERDSDEWPADFTYTHFFNYKNFSASLGLQTIVPFFQLGFVSKYIGVMGWVGGLAGIAVMEQLPLDQDWKIGLVEHIAQNGRESRLKESDCGGGFGPTGACLGDPDPIFYTEVGIGAYLSYKSFAIEFRYGRDISENRNRFTFYMNWMFSISKKEKQEEWIWR
ncbi:hypothetical protein [Fibrobacter sp.]|uniref:hypothetical protein n=1 Tax=Fibrobacter sp. TaxID=35828 RepID=UPI0025BF36DD|nr:hypothetical protein [Fibrobacter sp.]MBR3070660.1 hypothetical protein [Fibrobacter sp.]